MIKNIKFKSSLVHLWILLLLMIQPSCKKPGIGGEAKISGYIHVQKWNATFTQYLGEYPGKDLYVYIVYGNHTGYDKRIKTDYKGTFEFPYLYKGDYTIYCYSRDSTMSDLSGITPVIKKVVLEKYKSVVQIDTMLIFQ